MHTTRVHGRHALAGIGALLLWPASLLAEGSATSHPVELRLPAPIVYEKTVGPERAAVFRHETHVALAGTQCTGCHPRPFGMLKPEHRITHAAMKAGDACGACHDGRKAFGIRDSSACARCHAGRPAPGAMAAMKSGASGAPGLPKPIVYARSAASPGRVTFRHPAHAKGGCATCHPQRFAMKSGSAKSGSMHEAAACGGCHDGAKAFGVEDAASCARCHVEGK